MQTPKLSMVVVMGATGAGKSYFINQLAGGEVVKEGNSIFSCKLYSPFDWLHTQKYKLTLKGTQRCRPIPVRVGGTRILMIDTPGFDDAERLDSEILKEIAYILVGQHKLNVELKGVIYMHRLDGEVRYKRSAVKTLRIFRKICGEESMGNVLLTTSGWHDNERLNRDAFSRREGELRDSYWSCMVDCGSQMGRFYGDQTSAMMIVSQLLMKKPVVLDMQKELIDRGMELKDTAAGAYLYRDLEASEREQEESLALLAQERLRRAELRDKYPSMQGAGKDLEREYLAELQRCRDQQGMLNSCGRIDQKVDEEVKRSRTKVFLGSLPALAPFLGLVLHVLFALLGIQVGV